METLYKVHGDPVRILLKQNGEEMMLTELRRWQVRIETTEENDPIYEPWCIYGETIETLREAVHQFLREYELLRGFRNVGDHIAGRYIYAYSGAQFPLVDAQKRVLEVGWWVQKQERVDGQLQKPSSPARLADLRSALDHYDNHAFVPEKGPDYHSRALVGDDLRLALLEKVLRESNEYPTNDLILRGWHIIALEYKGELSIAGELLNRKAVFVMGHPEAQAASLTLNASSYKK